MATSRIVVNLVDAALKNLGVIAVGETATESEWGTGLVALQDIVAELSIDGLTVPFITQEAITLVADQVVYTVGENGSPDLSTVRPESIIGAFIRTDSNYDYPVTIISERAYRAILSKTEVSGRPNRLWYNPTVPNGTVSIFPAPSEAESLYIVSLKQLDEPATLTDDILNTLGIPRNYYNPLKWLLTLELCHEFGREPTPLMVARASTGYSNIVGMNAVNRVAGAVSDISYFGRGGVGVENSGVAGGDYITFGGDVVVF